MRYMTIEEKMRRYLYGNVVYEDAYAKINLGLKVLGKREDGYHELDMVNALVSCHDSLAFYDCKEVVEIYSSKKICSNEENIIYKTVMLIKEKYNIKRGVRVDLDKAIPVGAGLGGGSADAAATIRALNKLWNLKMSKSDMLEIANKVGSDVAYLIEGGFARVTGRGEKIEKIKGEIPVYVVVVYPNYPLSTKEVFNNHEHFESGGNIDNLIESIEKKRYRLLLDNLFNDLEPAANKVASTKSEMTPSALKELLSDLGCDAVCMTGSGSAVFGIVDNFHDLKVISNKIEKEYPDYDVIFAETVTSDYLKRKEKINKFFIKNAKRRMREESRNILKQLTWKLKFVFLKPKTKNNKKDIIDI